MEITCNIAMDLVDIYSSGVASEDTESAVREHLKTCRDCRKFYDEYKKAFLEEKKSQDSSKIKTETTPNLSEEILSESMKKLSKRLRTRRVVSNAVSIFSVIVGFVVLAKEVLDSVDEKGK